MAVDVDADLPEEVGPGALAGARRRHVPRRRPLHRAAPNPTGEVREVMTVIWFADGARLVDPVPPTQRLDARAWLPGCAPGELAASEKNPVIG